MPLYYEVPFENSWMHNQKQQIDISDEEFSHLYDPPNPPMKVRILRFLLFIIFLGPIRIVLTVVFFGIYFVFISILPLFRRFFKDPMKFKWFAFKVAHPILRAALFTMGFVHITKKGNIDPKAKVIICNHLTLIDVVSIFNQLPVAFVGTNAFGANIFVKNSISVFDAVLLDRSKKGHYSQAIAELIDDPSKLPVLIFPEGKVSAGDALLGFRTGGFLTNQRIQPITIRYRHWLCPKGMSTISWLHNSFVLYIYQVFSTPFYTMEVNVLPVPSWKDPSTTPQQKASDVQLMIANNLGTPALDRTNREIFQKEKAQ